MNGQVVSKDKRYEWEYSLEMQRPPGVSDTEWFAFMDHAVDYFSIDEPLKVTGDARGLLAVGLGIRGEKQIPQMQLHKSAGRAVEVWLPANDWLDETPTAAPEAKPSLLSRRIGDICAKPTTVRWLKRHELERGVIAVMAGPRGAYKSTQALNWIMYVCAILGEPVLWLTAEGSGTDRRVNAWLKKFAPHITADNLPLYVIPKRMALNTPQGQKQIYEELKAISIENGAPPSLCVIDTFSKYTPGLQEKDNSAVAEFLTGIDNAMRAPFDCSVLIIAHTGHSDQTRARGATAIESDTDAAYIVSKLGDMVSVTRERFKDSSELPPLTFKREIVDLGYTDAEGAPATAVVLNETTERLPPRTAAKAEQASGKNQIPAFETIKKMSPLCEGVDMDDLIEKALERRGIRSTHITKRDMGRAIEALADKRLAWIDRGSNQCGQGALKPNGEGDPFK